MDKKWKTVIVDLLTQDGLSVCLVSERWIVHDRVFYPTCGSYKVHKALVSHEEPDDSYEEYEFKLRKICAEDYTAARGLLKLAAEETDLSSEVEQKRKRRNTKRFSPSPIKKPKSNERQPMTAVYSPAFKLFMGDITDESANKTEKYPKNHSNDTIESCPPNMSSPIAFRTPENSDNDCAVSNEAMANEPHSNLAENQFNFSDISLNISETSEDERQSTSQIYQHGVNTTQSTMMTSDQDFTSDIEENSSEDSQRNTHFKQPPKTASEAAKLPRFTSRRQVENNVAASERNNHPSKSARTASSEAVVASGHSTHSSKSSKTTSRQSVVASGHNTRSSTPSKTASGQTAAALKRNTHFSKSSKTGPSQAVVGPQRTPQTSKPSKAASDEAVGASQPMPQSVQTSKAIRQKGASGGQKGNLSSSRPTPPQSSEAYLSKASPKSAKDDKIKFRKVMVTRADSMEAKLDECLALLRQMKLEQKNTLPPKEVDGLELPLQTIEDWESLEAGMAINSTKQWLVTQLSNLGGLSSGEKVQLVWKHLITDELGMELSWKGLNGKIPILGSRIFQAVIAAVGKGMIEGGKKEIEEITKDWIWTAKRRFERTNGPVPAAVKDVPRVDAL